MIRRPPISTPLYSSAASDVYKRQLNHHINVLDTVADGFFGQMHVTRKPLDSHVFFAPFADKMGFANACARSAEANTVNKLVNRPYCPPPWGHAAGAVKNRHRSGPGTSKRTTPLPS